MKIDYFLMLLTNRSRNCYTWFLMTIRVYASGSMMSNMQLCDVQLTIMKTTALNHFIASTYLSILAAIPAILGNALCIFIHIKTRSLHSPSNILVCALCISDLAVGIVAQPLSISTTIAVETGHKFENLWMLAGTAIISSSSVSCLLTFLVTADRYFAICHPLRYYEFATAKNYKIISSIAFCISSSMGPICSLLYINVLPYLATVQYLVMCTMVLMYVMIYRAIVHQRKSIRSTRHIAVENRNSAIQHKRERDKAYVIAVILTAFIICYLPMSIVYSLSTRFSPNPCFKGANQLVVTTWGSFFVLMNSSINPFVYSLMLKDVKTAIRHRFQSSFFCRR